MVDRSMTSIRTEMKKLTPPERRQPYVSVVYGACLVRVDWMTALYHERCCRGEGRHHDDGQDAVTGGFAGLVEGRLKLHRTFRFTGCDGIDRDYSGIP